MTLAQVIGNVMQMSIQGYLLAGIIENSERLYQSSLNKFFLIRILTFLHVTFMIISLLHVSP